MHNSELRERERERDPGLISKTCRTSAKASGEASESEAVNETLRKNINRNSSRQFYSGPLGQDSDLRKRPKTSVERFQRSDSLKAFDASLAHNLVLQLMSEERDTEEKEEDSSLNKEEEPDNEQKYPEKEKEKEDEEPDMDAAERGDRDEEEEKHQMDENFQEDLANITCEIAIKQKLIDELENSQDDYRR
ncbi:hypothetical protein WMY93_033030 [Mugilogobius chulae]|uniref:Uncharacterized protein n=1 Tax=Mugilogobius chulae TaxID=88201 RepID=A0AAW0MV27_9GOBI